MAQKSTVVAWWAFCCPNGRKGSLWRACLGLGLLDDVLLVIQTCSGSQLWVCCSWWELPFIGRHFPPIRSNVVAFLPPSVFLTDLALYTAGDTEWTLAVPPYIYYVKALSGGIEQETKMEGILHSQPVDSQPTKGSPVSAFLGLWEITSIHC